MISKEKSKGIIELNLEEARNLYLLVSNSRQQLRERAITVFSIFISFIGGIIVLSIDNIGSLTLIKDRPFYSCVLLILFFSGIFSFLWILLSSNSKIIEQPYTRMLYLNNTILDNKIKNEIKLTKELMIVDLEGYFKVDLIKSYKDATEFQIQSMNRINRAFKASILFFTAAIIITILVIMNIL